MTDKLEGRVDQLEDRMSTLESSVQQFVQESRQTQQRLDSVAENLDSVAQRLDSFIFESQRLFAGLGEKANRNEAVISSLIELARLHDRQRQEDRTENQAVFQRMNAMIGRLDTLVNYLMQSDSED